MSIDENEIRRDAIISYISDNDGCTQTQVTEYMSNRSSVVTTHKIIHQLIDKQSIIVEPDKANRQTHHLHINDKLALIDREINIIKKIMDSMDEPIRKFLKNRDSEPSEETLTEKLNKPRPPTNNKDFYNHVIFPYEDAVTIMLRILFKRINQTILSEKEADKLRRRIVVLLNRLTTQIFNITKESEYLDFGILALKTFELSTTKNFVKDNKIDLGIRRDIIKCIRDFEKKFLIT